MTLEIIIRNGDYDKRICWKSCLKQDMSRKLVWIEQERFRGFGCSECSWRFKPY